MTLANKIQFISLIEQDRSEVIRIKTIKKLKNIAIEQISSNILNNYFLNYFQAKLKS